MGILNFWIFLEFSKFWKLLASRLCWSAAMAHRPERRWLLIWKKGGCHHITQGEGRGAGGVCNQSVCGGRGPCQCHQMKHGGGRGSVIGQKVSRIIWMAPKMNIIIHCESLQKFANTWVMLSAPIANNFPIQRLPAAVKKTLFLVCIGDSAGLPIVKIRDWPKYKKKLAKTGHFKT